MEYTELRELVHIRHELRRLVTSHERTGVRPAEIAEARLAQHSQHETLRQARDERLQEALSLLTQMSALAERDPIERESTAPEVERWRVRLGL